MVKETRFECAMCALSALRYLATAMSQPAQFELKRHLMAECHLLSLVRPLVEKKPWRRETTFKGQSKAYEHFQAGQWTELRAVQRQEVTLPEVQAWLVLWAIAASQWFNEDNMTERDREELVYIGKSLLTPRVIQKIEAMRDVKTQLTALEMQSNLPQAKPRDSFFQIHEIDVMTARKALLEEFEEELGPFTAEKLAAKVEANLKAISHNDDLKALGQLYGGDDFSSVAEVDRCACCGSTEGISGKLLRCSRCKKVMYCSRECQKADWKRHKLVCAKV
ncbi:zinc finger MYND domain-containing protein [Carpediemonas membranifera]|uniref:Zinc finger MYND domain-containing protein n=1 Tax=Carpediemonas membranifera TaxID=201153 RepID=A0A8J6E380_9EUKA|nr:zinc finger MYND domain-containing protein [Carpediemonas membranifera]|eukprot:KAG9392797.1 zinc finger MYND domain-containing protein [Carpediemonas membranifera]